MDAKTIEQVLRQNTDRLLSLSGVVGMAQGLAVGKSCINIYVVKKTPELMAQIPSVLGGYSVVVRETDELHSRGDLS